MLANPAISKALQFLRNSPWTLRCPVAMGETKYQSPFFCCLSLKESEPLPKTSGKHGRDPLVATVTSPPAARWALGLQFLEGCAVLLVQRLLLRHVLGQRRHRSDLVAPSNQVTLEIWPPNEFRRQEKRIEKATKRPKAEFPPLWFDHCRKGASNPDCPRRSGVQRCSLLHIIPCIFQTTLRN